MSDSPKLIFVTGASGFLASHVIHELTKQGYRVRASARKNKVEPLRELYKSVPSIEIVEIADIAHGEFEELLQGVDAVIHTASPLPGRQDVDSMLKSAIDGSLNVLKQAEKVGIKKFVVTGSTISVRDDPRTVGVSFRADHWNPVTKEQAKSGNKSVIYAVAKKYAELAIWEWAEANPHVDVTTINPPFLYGPFAPLHLPVAPGDFSALSSDIMVYSLLIPTGVYPPGPGYADFRDVAKAHVGALRTPPTVEGRKRIIFSTPDGLDFNTVFATLKKARPELEGRLINQPPPVYPFDRYDIDFDRVEEVTGMKKSDFHTTEETFVDTVNDILDLEKVWIENGYVIPKTLPSIL
ncbi:Putative uncharacterized oxidoreductase [Psilocybe cubensis]|uniref:NAD-dependent epimerase/dehydratase domain-containing protein n=2 Tax=Psilocybe cubensis TaxID=181762 RepID=A0A8H8CMY8_PSICU|nr:Putative uncharacterized oxidoreductase [Psilocybe cubensis]KAH9484972.1 Putative uncharacterized oxidoreductase [Psilocybe cubensis]